ncbi:hypothetical protein GCM10009665_04960 [Kitasatospora nipponensis]|uniref:DUF3060 family protein n=1 Tax=Kitasatospora nipponensis TaxID=258049 RepID=A0ABP4G9H3_9ACTN
MRRRTALIPTALIPTAPVPTAHRAATRRATPGRLLSAGLLVAAVLATSAGCGKDIDIGCKAPECHLTVKDGSSLTIAGQTLTVTGVDDDSVKFDSHGIAFTLKKDLSLGFGKYHLHLQKVESGSADITVDDK